MYDEAGELIDPPPEIQPSSILFVHEHSKTLPDFTSYVSRLVSDVTIADMASVLDGPEQHHDFVVATERVWEQIKHKVSGGFVLRVCGIMPTDHRPLGAIGFPRYKNSEFMVLQKLRDARPVDWLEEDSIRYYAALYFETNAPVPGSTIVDLARRGEGPHKNRFLQGMKGMGVVRAAAGLEAFVYQRGLSLQDRIQILREIAADHDHLPTVDDIQAALERRGGPSYSTLLGDMKLPQLREVAGLTGTRAVDARREATRDWSAEESIALYRNLCAKTGRVLKRRELEPELAKLGNAIRRPTIRELLAPFVHPELGTRGAFIRMQEAAGFEPSRRYRAPDTQS